MKRAATRAFSPRRGWARPAGRCSARPRPRSAPRRIRPRPGARHSASTTGSSAAETTTTSSPSAWCSARAAVAAGCSRGTMTSSVKRAMSDVTSSSVKPLQDLGALRPRRLGDLDQPDLVGEEPESRPQDERPAHDAGLAQELHQQDLGLAHHQGAVEIEDGDRRRLAGCVTWTPSLIVREPPQLRRSRQQHRLRGRPAAGPRTGGLPR